MAAGTVTLHCGMKTAGSKKGCPASSNGECIREKAAAVQDTLTWGIVEQEQHQEGERHRLKCQSHGAQVGWSFEVKQPDKWMWVTVGQTLTLNCTVTASGPIGPVKWVKGWGSSSQTVYDRKSSSRRVTRALKESNTDFTIHIVDIHPEDAGTYYCVKFEKKIVDNEMLSRGQGTKVSVYETSPFPSIEVAAAVLCFVLLIFILAFCLYRRKQRGGEQSQHVAEVTTGSCSPFPVPCCAGSPGTPSEVQDAENPKLMHQQSSEVDKDIHYADLQHLPAARWPSRRHGAEHSEYASIRAAAK